MENAQRTFSNELGRLVELDGSHLSIEEVVLVSKGDGFRDRSSDSKSQGRSKFGGR